MLVPIGFENKINKQHFIVFSLFYHKYFVFKLFQTLSVDIE